MASCGEGGGADARRGVVEGGIRLDRALLAALHHGVEVAGQLVWYHAVAGAAAGVAADARRRPPGVCEQGSLDTVEAQACEDHCFNHSSGAL